MPTSRKNSAAIATSAAARRIASISAAAAASRFCNLALASGLAVTGQMRVAAAQTGPIWAAAEPARVRAPAILIPAAGQAAPPVAIDRRSIDPPRAAGAARAATHLATSAPGK